MASSIKYDTLDNYTFDLRKGLSDAAKLGLGQLEGMIGDLGYGWLDGHMEEILSRGSRGPIMELMKTPSRTQTVKKTRAMTTAMKDKGEKIKALNLQVGSPASKAASPSRAALSPLQPRSLNTARMLSPSPMKSQPAKMLSPIQGSPLRAAAPSKKKGLKPKALMIHDENGQDRPDAASQRQGLLSPTPKVPPKSPARLRAASPAARSGASPQRGNEPLAPALPIQQKPSSPVQRAPSPVHVQAGSSVSAPNRSRPADEDAQQAQRSASVGPASREKPVEEDEEDTTIRQEETAPPAPAPSIGPEHEASAEQPTSEATPAEAPIEAASQAHDSSALPPDDEEEAIAPAPVAPVAAPMRQVRSSWLSKALGNGAAPGRPSETSTARTSFAPSSHRAEPIDFSTLRKSLAPAGTLASTNPPTTAAPPRTTLSIGTKRPSDGVVVEEEKRPEKIFKVEHAPQTAFQQTRTSDGPKSTAAAAVAASIFGPKTPAVSKAPVPASDSSKTAAEPILEVVSTVPTLEQARADRHRSDIHKVTRALDELRERTAAKDAQKQKAALHASGGPRTTVSAGDRQSTAGPTANGGFFRGLGSLGVGLGRSLGLGGSAKNAEDEAARLQAELEEDRRAEEEAKRELDKLMGEMQEEDVETQDDVETQVETRVADAPSEKKEDLEDEIVVAGELDEPETAVEESKPVESPVAVKSPARAAPPVTRSRSPPAAPIPSISQITHPASNSHPTPVKVLRDVFESTTPTMSPPRRIFNMPTAKVTSPKPEVAAAPVREAVRPAFIQPSRAKSPAAEPAAPKQAAPGRKEAQAEEENADDELGSDAELPDLPEPAEADDERTDSDDGDDEGEEEEAEMPAKKMFKPSAGVMPKQNPMSSSTSIPALARSTSSNAGVFGHASTIGAKTLGFKPVTGQVKSIQVAAAAAKREAATTEKKAAMRAEVEQRKNEALRKKQEEERVKAEEDKKARAAELEEKRKIRLEQDKRRKEREEKLALAAKEKAIKEEAERAAAKAKADEENKKRKLAQAALLNKSQQPPAKKVAGGTGGLGSKGKEPLRTIKPMGPSSSMAGGSKPGPTSFRTAETVSTTTTSTMALVQPKTAAPFGLPARPSSQLPFGQQPPKPSVVLQQQRSHLQSQLDEKAAEIASEDIVLPDIASEYSDSDDSDRETDFKRPQWAESPELRNALMAQASRNPDELFGPIKPLNMEELFKTKTNKFRARTSSANWNGGDRLTKAEEVEYAKRMGFRPIGKSGLGGGSGL